MKFSYLSFLVLELIWLGQAENYDTTVLVLHSGSDAIKAGFAGETNPMIIFTPVIGRPKKKDDLVRKVYVGANAEEFGNNLDLSYPIENGTIKNWEDMRILWTFAFFDSLRISPEEHPILLTELPRNSQENRQKMAEIMFDVFNIPALYIANQAYLALYSTNRKTGIVLYHSYDVTYSVPIFDGQVISHAVISLEVGRRDLNNFFIELLHEASIYIEEKTIIHDMKEKLCYVALNYQQDMQTSSISSSLDESYELPNGSIVKLGYQLFTCPEALFKPSLLGINREGIHEVLYNSIMQCVEDQRAILYENIVLTGISFQGIKERFTKEITAMVPPTIHVNVVAEQSMTWTGGSKFASEPSFETKMITKEAYKKFGPSIIM